MKLEASLKLRSDRSIVYWEVWMSAAEDDWCTVKALLVLT